MPNCSSDADGSWSPDLPADSAATLQCTPDPPADEVTSDDPPEAVDCEDAGAQYQLDEPQYQTPATATCDASDDPVVPISEPEPPATAAPESGEAAAPTSVVSPTAEPVNAPVAPVTEPTPCSADVLPTSGSPPTAATKPAGSRFIVKPSRPRLASSRQRMHTERVIPAQARPVSLSVAVRPRPLRARGTKPKASIARSRIEAAAPRSLEPTSSHGSLFGDWFVSTLSLSLVFALGLLLTAVAIAAGRLLRARVGSKGLSDRHIGTSKSGGIRYRE